MIVMLVSFVIFFCSAYLEHHETNN